MAHIFVSYARKDVDAATRLIGTLAKAGYEAWIDQEIPGGELWKKRIVEAIENAQAFLVLLSPDSVVSDNVRKELDMADKRRKLIFPVVVAPTKIPHEMEYSLAGLQLIDSTNPDSGDRQLLNALKSLHAFEETGWPLDTIEGRKKLDAILANPSRSFPEKMDDYMNVFREFASVDDKAWKKKMDDYEARIRAISAEQDMLRKQKMALTRELEASSAEIGKLIREKMADLDKRDEALSSELSGLRDPRFDQVEEHLRRYDKMSEIIDKSIEKSNKLNERILPNTVGRNPFATD